MTLVHTKGCDAFGAKLYFLWHPGGRRKWFRQCAAAKAEARRLARKWDNDAYEVHRVILTAKLSPKALALALLNGDSEAYAATTERV